MRHIRVISIMMLVMALAPAALAQAEPPTIAILSYGPSTVFALAEKGVMDVLEAYGYISAEERAVAAAKEDLEGARVNVLHRDAGFDFATGNLMIQDVVDRGANILISFSTPLSQMALANTIGMEDPPQIIFAIVATPYAAGLAEAPCVKRANITGTQAHVPYDEFIAALKVFDPALDLVGTISNPSEPNSNVGSDIVAELGIAHDISVITQGAASMVQVPLAAEGLIDKGVDAILVMPGQIGEAGMTAIVNVALEQGIPVMGPMANHIYRGALIGAGFNSMYREGVNAGRMLVGHLQGLADLSRTAINLTPGFTVAVNLDIAAAMDIEINDAVMEMAHFTLENGISTESQMSNMEGTNQLPEMALEARRASDQAFLDALLCTDEMIAEQKAELGL